MSRIHHSSSTLPWIRKNKSIISTDLKSKIKRRKHEHKQCGSINEFFAFEVLIRLPIKDLLACKSVCKLWHALLSDPTFVAAHLKHSREDPQLVVVALSHEPSPRGIAMYTYEEGRKKSRLFFEEEFRAVQTYLLPPKHCNGLVLLTTQTELVVCNPSTKESVALPPSVNWKNGTQHCTASLGYVESMNTYKVANYVYRYWNSEDKTYDLRFEVLTLGTDFSWRVVKDPPYLIGACVSPESVGEVIYFIISNSLHCGSPKAFLCFNLKDEKFRVVNPPYGSPVDYNNMSIVNLEGNPCFIHRSKDRKKYKMWISRDFIEHVWVPTFSFDLMEPPRFVSPLSFSRGKLLLEIHDEVHRLEYYDPQSKVFDPVICIPKDLTFYDEENCDLHIFSESASFAVVNYVERLVSIRPKS